MASIWDLFKKIETEREAPKPITHLVVGLGNPGKDYEMTRHNAGFMALDRLAETYPSAVTRARFRALTGETEIAGKRVLLMKPQTYMNHSGEAVRDAADFYKIPPENVLVICDDVSFDVGRLRIRRKGSDGGQKGLQNIIYQLRSDAFPRIRLGVGKKPEGGDLTSWVLGRIPEAERKTFSEVLDRAAEAVPLILNGEIDRAMSECNGL